MSHHRIARALRLVYLVDTHVAARAEHVRACLDAGVTTIWLRDRAASGASICAVGRPLRQWTRDAGAALVVSDRVDVAKAIDADGVHIGRHAPALDLVQRWTRRWVGVSCHDGPALAHAARQQASYATLSPIGVVPGKGTPLGVDGFADGVARVRTAQLSMPVVALGAVDRHTARALIGAGAAGVAVRRALRDADDPAAVARALRAVVERANDARVNDRA